MAKNVRQAEAKWDAVYNPSNDVRPSSLLATTPGVTEQLFANNYLDSLGEGYPLLRNEIKEAGYERVADPTIPTLDAILGALNLKDDEKGKPGKQRTAVQKFIEDFPAKQKEWKKKVSADPVFGERAWDLVTDTWRKTVHDDAVAQTRQGMEDAVNDGSVSGFIARTLFPRTTEHIANTGDFTAKDMALDLGENAAMLVPGPTWLSIPGKIPGVRKAVAAGARKASRIADVLNKNPFGAALTTGVGMGRNIAGNAVVPVGMEAVDDLAYDEGEGMDQRADFSIGDAAIGTGVNQMVNRGVYKVLGPLLTETSGEVTRGAGVKKLRDLLGSIGRSSSAPGNELASRARMMSEVPVKEPGMVTIPEVNAFRTGAEAPVDAGITREEFKKWHSLNEIIKSIEKGDTKPIDVRKLERDAEKAFDRNLSKAYEARVENILNARDWNNGTGKMLPWEDLVKAQEGISTAANSARQVRASQLLDEKNIPLDVNMPRELLKLEADNINPLYNYAVWHGKGPGAATVLEKTGNALKVAVPTWLANKAGRDSMTNAVVSRVDPEGKLNKERDEVHAAPTRRSESKAASRILAANEGVSAKGEQFLRDLAQHPEYVTIGHPTDPDGFKLWLLTEGRDLLRGSELDRPTWEVK